MWKNLCLILVLLYLIDVRGYKYSLDCDGCETYQIPVQGPEDVRKILQWRENNKMNFVHNTDLEKNLTEITVNPREMDELLNFLMSNDSQRFPDIYNYNKISETMDRMQNEYSKYRSQQGLSNISRYMSYDEMVDYTSSLVHIQNPDNKKKLVQIEIIGKSYHKTDVVMIKISSDHEKMKPIILMDAALHAREWAGPPTVLYLVQQLVENYTMNKDILQRMDFYIIPVANPDGYEYSRNFDRLWRKTLSPQGNCVGVDGNRNFNYFWGFSGTSDDECSLIYKGPTPFSEAETRNIGNVGIKYSQRLLGYISVHTYGGYILYPWGYTKKLPDDWHRLDICAESFSRAIKYFSGTEYKYGSAARLLYEAAGGSDDWMKGVLKVPFSYTIELAASEREGFALDEYKLSATGMEIFEGIKSLINCFLNLQTFKKFTNS